MKGPLSLFAALAAFVAFAEPLSFTVRNDHADLIYRTGEMATFTVTAATTNGAAASSGRVEATLDNFGPKNLFKGAFDLSTGNVFTVCGKLDEPGFLRLTLRTKDNAKDFIWSVGYDPTQIRKGSPSPADFDAFWSDARARLAREIPLDAQVVRVPERCTRDFEYFRISFATFGRRVHGYMSVPTDKTRAPFPVDFSVAAAGFGGWTNDMQGKKDAICVFFSVFPFEPDWRWKELGLKASRYDAMNEVCKAKYGTGYTLAGIAESREAYFFYPVILGIDRAIDWLAARPDVNPARFTYQGTSQGGCFGCYLGGLNRHFTKVALFVPAGTDIMGCLAGRRSTWPWPIDDVKDPARRAAIEKIAPYFDGANFASRIRCPVRVVVGFADTCCPPGCVYAMYNEIPVADKAILHGFGMPHSVYGTFYSQVRAWLGEGR